jgi:hypothetical protein
LDFTRIYRKKIPSCRKFDTIKLRDGKIRGQFVERLKDDLGSVDLNPEPVESINDWNNIKRVFTNVSQEVLSYQKNQRKDYISDETWKLSKKGRGQRLGDAQNQIPNKFARWINPTTSSTRRSSALQEETGDNIWMAW